MPAFTVNRNYPYSVPTDPADIPQALQDLAEAIADDVCALTNGVTGRPVARFRGTGTFNSESPAFSLGAPPTDSFYRVPFDTEDFDTIGVTMQSQEVGNRLILPDVPGFYFAIGTVYVPTLTTAGAVVNFLDIELQLGDASNPLGATTKLAGSSHNIAVDANDRNVRVFSLSSGTFMNGTTDAFALEFRADTTPNIAEYPIAERTLTILRMTTS